MSDNNASNAKIEYLQGRSRKTGHEVNDFEAYADSSMIVYWRSYKSKPANYNHDLDVSIVVDVSNAIVSSSNFSSYSFNTNSSLILFHLDPIIYVSTTNTHQDLVENNENAMDQIIWGMTHRDDVHPGIASIVANAALVDLLLVRHYKKWGGLVLPPLQAARGLQDSQEVAAEQEKQRGLTWASGRSMMKYPNW
jgi:hypothetical protein